MRYSLRTLLMVMMLGAPALALLWWLRHKWTVQVFGIIAMELAALSLICGLATLIERLVRLLIGLRN